MKTSRSKLPDACPELLIRHASDKLALIADSYQRLTGRTLIEPGSDLVATMWTLPQVVLAHGIEDDPIFFFGNRLALELFEVTPEQIIKMPSRLSAEAMLREEREALLERVTRDGYIDDYQGVRISSTGQRFLIKQATVWNLIDERGVKHGQAATFSQWEFLESK
ncbi:MAG TPA: MEKHLA domain-containing protein [Pseudohongiella sp.]|nr:MEKHLA domain-containing protein [Pseudohongiella sp.]